MYLYLVLINECITKCSVSEYIFEMNIFTNKTIIELGLIDHSESFNHSTCHVALIKQMHVVTFHEWWLNLHRFDNSANKSVEQINQIIKNTAKMFQPYNHYIVLSFSKITCVYYSVVVLQFIFNDVYESIVDISVIIINQQKTLRALASR